MARFQHTVTLAPMPRRWFESCVATLHDLAEDTDAEDTSAEGARLRLPDGRPLPGLVLAQGRHLRPGARYRPVNAENGEPDADQCVTVLAWDRRRETALEVVTVDGAPDHPARLDCALRLTSAERPREAALSAVLTPTGGKWEKYLGGTGRVHLDLGRWWQATGDGRHPSRAPLSGTLTHALARVGVTVVPRPGPDGRWLVTVKMRVRGRSFARPLLPLAAALLGRRARRACAESLDRAATAWNAQVPALVRKDRERLRAELTDALLGA
ncbi:hypothetical protein [Streptomyces salinarius]|uniref:hypothetical protein n=1 Tax=Streptomyces salinarius TaxID=2762598 RepID=UPI0021BD971E|nr:hypothetical protein [Streptomyces salinarius]